MVIFIVVLSGCSQVGLVDERVCYLELMGWIDGVRCVSLAT